MKNNFDRKISYNIFAKAEPVLRVVLTFVFVGSITHHV